MVDESKAARKQNEGLARFTTQAILFFFFVLLFSLGIAVRAVGLREPDTCFLLALGRWIVEHQHLPLSDPFSWTYALYPNGAPYVVYQWLTEVIFYWLVRYFGPVSLVILGAITLTLAYVIFPQRYSMACKTGPLVAFLLSTLGALSALSHINIRPELFSYVFLALYCQLLLRCDQSISLNWKLVGSLVAAMILWCNLHSGFVIGLLLLLFWTLSSQSTGSRQNCLAALPLCAAATLVNPVGWNLWRYLPFLFFSPINRTIHELRPFTLLQVIDPLFAPFLLLTIIYLISSGLLIKNGRLDKSLYKLVGLGLIAVVTALSAYRMIMFATILMVAALAPIMAAVTHEVDNSFSLALKKHLARWLHLPAFGWTALCLLIPVLSAYAISCSLPATVPEGSKAFSPPEAAIKYLHTHRPPGRLFNDPFFGDVMMWEMTQCPPLYVDTRYDIYAPEVMDKYHHLLSCKTGWQRILQDLSINWIMLPPNTALIANLRNSKDWQVIFADRVAVILQRQATSEIIHRSAQ